MNKNFDKIYSDFLLLIENKLQDVIEKSKPDSVRIPFEYLIENGGKRLRPVLAMISCGACGGDPKESLNPAVALEILHNFTLAHDDLMDSSPLRRGKPTVHEKFSPSVAILLGDAMIGYGLKLLPDNKNVLDLFIDAHVIVCQGQALDMDYNERNDISESDYLEMIRQKTANLIRASVLIGARLGNASQDNYDNLEKFSSNLGLAFQIQDDYLDLAGKSDEIGKDIGQDIIEGKKTLMIIKCKGLAKEESDKKLIEKFYENNGLEKSEINNIRQLMQKLHIFDEIKDIINSYFEKAKTNLDKLPENQYREMLGWILEKTRSRQS
jgi:geranylgeranyl pyrophosphate synthase